MVKTPIQTIYAPYSTPTSMDSIVVAECGNRLPLKLSFDALSIMRDIG